MAMLVCGYSVVSSPECNFEEDAEVELFRKAPQLNGVYYSGYQRNEFGEMDSLFRRNLLPEACRKMFSRVRANQAKGLYDYYITEIYDDAVYIKEYLNGLGGKFEVIALYSKTIERFLGSRKIDDAAAIFLGYDVCASGYSLVLSSLFERPDLFNEETLMVNGSGLLNDLDSISKLIHKYISIQDKENIEQIDPSTIDVVAVSKLL